MFASRYVRMFTKKVFSDFNEIWCLDRGRWVMHDCMPYDPIQGQGHELLKFWKLHFSSSISSAIYNGSWQMSCSVLFCSLAVLDPSIGHTMDVLSPFISILCHSDWLFHRESYPRLDVVYPGCAWSCSPSYTWHCSLHYFFLQAIPLFPHGVTIVC